jgi:beta-barrel assembly-enhancing protease
MAQRALGARPDPKTDEGGLWTESDKAERAAKNSAEVDPDPKLAAYIQDIACKVGAEYCKDLRVYVMDRPFFNASAAPNGYIEIWSGALLRANDEAEVAFILSHEISHYAQNHSIKAWRAAKARANAAMAVGVIAGIALSAATFNSTTGVSSFDNYAGSFVDIVYLGAMASMFSFSREQETEADALGQDRLTTAGYASSASVSVWQSRLSESQASDFPQVRKNQVRTGIFDSHPVTQERLKALQERTKSGGDLGPERLRAVIRPHLASWLRDDMRRRDYGETLHVIDRLSQSGEDLGVLTYFKAESYRLRRGDGDLTKAKESYAAAIQHADAPVAAWRELGELRRKEGDRTGARQAFEGYLAKAPEAEDAWLVQDALKTLK